MEPTKNTEQTETWIRHHVVASSTKPDFTWYVTLDLIYQGYYDFMKAHRANAVTKVEFGDLVKLTLGPSIRVQERPFSVRRYDHRARAWFDTAAKIWVIDGARYYTDKIGGQYVFGI